MSIKLGTKPSRKAPTQIVFKKIGEFLRKEVNNFFLSKARKRNGF